MTTKQAALSLGVSVRAVRQMIEDGRLRATKNGRDWYVSKSSVGDMIYARDGLPR